MWLRVLHPALEITVAAVVGSSVGVMTFDAPVPSAFVLNIPHSGSGSITILGLNFATIDRSLQTSIAAAGALGPHYCAFFRCSVFGRMLYTVMELQNCCSMSFK